MIMEKASKFFAGSAIALAFASISTLALLSWGFVPDTGKAPQAEGPLASRSSSKAYAKTERDSQTPSVNPSNQLGKVTSTGLAAFPENSQSFFPEKPERSHQSPEKPQQHLSASPAPIAYAASSRSGPGLVTVPISAPISARTTLAAPPAPAAKESVQLPAAMVEVNPETSITTDTQVAEWERLQEEFVAEVNNKLPADTASRRAWARAQRQNDELFRAKFGTEAFLRQQLDAYRNGISQN